MRGETSPGNGEGEIPNIEVSPNFTRESRRQGLSGDSIIYEGEAREGGEQSTLELKTSSRRRGPYMST